MAESNKRRSDTTSDKTTLSSVEQRNADEQKLALIDRVQRAMGGMPEQAQALPTDANGVPVDPNVQQQAFEQVAPERAPAEPLPEPSPMERLGALGHLIPIFGGKITKPLRDVQERRAKIQATDKALYDQAIGLMDTNPDAASEMMKQKRYQEAFERHANIGPEDLESISEMSKALPMSVADTLKALQIGEGTGTLKGQDDVQIQDTMGKREELADVEADLRQKAIDSGKDPNSITGLDARFAHAQAAAGRGRYQIQANKKGIGFVDVMTGETLDITPETLRSSNMEVVPIEGEFGEVLGYTVIDKDDTKNQQPVIFEHMIQDRIDELMAEQQLSPENITPEQKDAIEKEAKEGWFKDAKILAGEIVTYVGKLNKNNIDAMITKGIFGDAGTKAPSKKSKPKTTTTTTSKPAPKKNPKIDKYF